MNPRLQPMALAVALTALVVLGLRPTRRVSVRATDIVLATPGAPPALVQRLADSARASVVRIPDDIPDAATLVRSRRDLRTVIVAGWGLDGDDAAALAGIAITPRPAPLPRGVAHVSWPAVVSLGEPLVIDGAVQGAPTGAILQLIGPGGLADSMRASDEGRFRLSDVPRTTGRHTYAVQVAGTVESLGVWVAAPAPPRALLLQAAPSFEARVLRDWLAASGGAVAVRTAVSRDRWRTEFVNRGALPLVPLRDRVLDDFDVVVTDARTLDELAAPERRALDRAVTDRGLGLIVLGSALPGFTTAPMLELGERRVRPELPGLPPPRTAIAVEPAALLDRFGVRTLVRDGSGVAIAQAAPRGAGWVALSLATETSPWRRAGEPDVYAAFWSRLLTAVARTRVPWRPGDGPHVTDRPIAVTGPAGNPSVRVRTPAGEWDSVFVAPDRLEPGRAQGTYWPRSAGWHTLAPDGPDSVAFLVTPPGRWRGVVAADRVTATARAAVSAPPPGVPLRSPHTDTHPVPLGWVFVLFVGAVGYLWAARR